MSYIHVDDAALDSLTHALETAGQDYKEKLARLTNLIEEITSGDIQGDPADDLLAKYRAKEDTFNQLRNTIEEAEEYMGMQTKKFETMITEVKEEMR